MPPVASIPLVARYTWKRHWPAVALEGFSWGIIGLSSFAVKRTLGGPDRAVPFLVALWQVGWIFSPAVGPLLARAHPQKLWRRLGVLAFAPIVCVAFVHVEPAGEPGYGTGNLMLFLVLTIAHYTMSVASVPHRGALMRTNYPRSVRGRIFGSLTAVQFLGAAVAAKACAVLLDHDPRWLRVLFPVAGVAGFLGYWRLGRIRWRFYRQDSLLLPLAERPLAAMRRAMREAVRILREDRAFRTYEAGFMLYGFGFLCSIVLLVLYAVNVLELTYGDITWAQFVAFPIGQVCAAPLFGRLSDRLGLARTSALAFGVLGCFFGLIPFIATREMFILSYVLWGVAMAGVNMGWALGPLHFAPDRQGHMYTAIHFSLVGVRSVVAPFLGYAVKQLFSFGAGFGTAVVLEALAILCIWRLGKQGH
jgi:MFS family permease